MTGDTMARVCVVVLNWNGCEDTVECVTSLLPQVCGSLASVVVIDNASTDDSFSQLAKWMKKTAERYCLDYVEGNEGLPGLRNSHLALLRAESNCGYAAGNNLGIHFALSNANYEFVWILNNDTVVDEHALAALTSFADRSPRTGIIGSTIVEYRDQGKIQYAGGARYNAWLTVFRPAFGNLSLEQAVASRTDPRLDYVSGAAMFVRVDLIKKIGLLNPAYFLYFEEVDYAQRAKRAGYGLGWCRSSVVCHKGGASLARAQTSIVRKSALAEYHSNLSALRYTRRFHRWLFPIASAIRMQLKIVSSLARREVYLLRPLFLAYKDFLLHKDAR